MSNQDYLFFYSEKCVHCKEFLQLLLRDQPLYKKFIKINIENNNIKIPPYIKSVPSIIVPVNGKANVLVGTKAFQWYQDIHKETVKNNSIKDWDPMTMSGYSDGYSYLESGPSMEKNFSFLGKTDKIYTPKDDGEKMTSNNSSQFQKSGTSKAFDDLLKQRSMDMPKGPQRM